VASQSLTPKRKEKELLEIIGGPREGGPTLVCPEKAHDSAVRHPKKRFARKGDCQAATKNEESDHKGINHRKKQPKRIQAYGCCSA